MIHVPTIGDFVKLSERFDLKKTQYELDFVDIDPSRDLRLFIDPYFLARRHDQWSISASRTIRSFFEYFITLLRTGEDQQARDLFEHLREPNETCLGLSRGAPRGNGIGESNADDIFESLKGSRAVKTGVVADLEDCRLFIKGIDKDKTSDMATNIIRGHLIEYTIAQCELWGIPLQDGIPSGFVWDRMEKEWINLHTKMLIVDDRRLLLVPKAIVSYAKRYAAKQYHQHFVLTFLQHEHLRLNSVLVEQKERKDGTVTRRVTKKSVVDYEAPSTKEYLAKFTETHPEVFKEFKEFVASRQASIPDREFDPGQLDSVIDYLIELLESIPAGGENATLYHRTVLGILELLFYPNLTAPQIERDIHDGRKRIDITFDNGAQDGFFWNLHTISKVTCPFVFVECKNYSRDVANPEVDQIAGRFSPNRGRFGLVLCRSVENMSLLLARCADVYKDERGVVIPMEDADLIEMLRDLKRGIRRPEERFLTDRFREVVLQ
jgi:hypothetical protein